MIGEQIEEATPGSTYDHNFVVNGADGVEVPDAKLSWQEQQLARAATKSGAVNGLRKVARVEEPSNGRVLEIWSNQPGVQFYAGK